jgi:Ca2+-binding EF-hand superfamily protein
VASAEDNITFEEFVTFMIERAQDKETPEQVRAAFKLIANNKVRPPPPKAPRDGTRV